MIGTGQGLAVRGKGQRGRRRPGSGGTGLKNGLLPQRRDGQVPELDALRLQRSGQRLAVGAEGQGRVMGLDCFQHAK